MRNFHKITGNKLLGRLSKKQLEEFADSFKEVNLKKKEMAFSPGQNSTNIFLVMKGRIKVFLTYPDGKEFTLTLLEPGDIFSGHTRAFGQALEDSVMLAVPLNVFREMLKKYPDLTFSLVRVLGDALKHSLNVIEKLVFMEAGDRLAKHLYQWTLDRGIPVEGGILVKTGLTRNELASVIGTTRQTLATLLKDFEAREIIKVNKRDILGRDVETLKNFVIDFEIERKM